jgi:hypothetical protein
VAATIPNPRLQGKSRLAGRITPIWPHEQTSESSISTDQPARTSSGFESLQLLLAFCTMHHEVRRREAQISQENECGATSLGTQGQEQFGLDYALHLALEWGMMITGVDGLAIALAENDEIVLRAAVGTVRSEVGLHIDRNSEFSGASLRMAQLMSCEDTETDARVNLQACRRLNARSTVAAPLCAPEGVIGLLQAFSTEPFRFKERDVCILVLLAELVGVIVKQKDEVRLGKSPHFSGAESEATMRTASKPIENDALAADVCTENLAPALIVDPKPVLWEITSAQQTDFSRDPMREIEKIPDAEIAGMNTPVRPGMPTGSQESTHFLPIVELVMLLILVGAAMSIVGVWLGKRDPSLAGATLWPRKTVTKGMKAGSPIKRSLTPPSAPTSTAANTSNVGPEAISEGVQAHVAATPSQLSRFPQVLGIRNSSTADSGTVVIDLQRGVRYEVHRLTGPDRIYVDLYDTNLAPDLAAKLIGWRYGPLKRIRVAQPVVGVTRVVVETKGARNFSVSLERDPLRLVVDVRENGGK